MGCGTSKSQVVLFENTKHNARPVNNHSKNRRNRRRKSSGIEANSLNDSHVLLVHSNKVPRHSSSSQGSVDDLRRGSLSLPRNHPRRSTIPFPLLLNNIKEKEEMDPHDNDIEEFPKYKKRDSINTEGRFGTLRESLATGRLSKSSVRFHSYDSLIVDQENESSLLSMRDSLASSIIDVESARSSIATVPVQLQRSSSSTFVVEKSSARASSIFVESESSDEANSDFNEDWKPKRTVKKRSISLDPTIAALTTAKPRSIVKKRVDDEVGESGRSSLSSLQKPSSNPSLSTSRTSGLHALNQSGSNIVPNDDRKASLSRQSSSNSTRERRRSSSSNVPNIIMPPSPALLQNDKGASLNASLTSIHSSDTSIPKSNNTSLLAPFKRAGFSDQDAYEMALLKHVVTLQGSSKADYSNAWGGSQKEYEKEKDFESLMTGEMEEKGIFAKLTLSPKELALGRWLKTLNGQGFFVYVHTASHEISGVPPEEDFVDMSDKVATTTAQFKQKQAAQFANTTLTSICTPIQLSFPSITNIFQKENKIPLIVLQNGDTSDALVAQLKKTSPSAKLIVVDTRPLVLPFARTKVKPADAVEAVRAAFVKGMKEGGLVLVDTFDQCPSWELLSENPKFKASLPSNLFNPTSRNHYKSMFIRAKGDGSPIMHTNYAVCFCSTLPERKLKSDFEGHVNWDYLKPVVFQQNAQVVPINDVEEHVVQTWSLDKRLPIIVGASLNIEKALEVTKCIQMDISELSDLRCNMKEFSKLLQDKVKFCRSHGVPLILQLKNSLPSVLDPLVNDDGALPADIFSQLQKESTELSSKVQQGFSVVLSTYKGEHLVEQAATSTSVLKGVSLNLFSLQ